MGRYLWKTKIMRCSEENNVSKAPDKADSVRHSEKKTINGPFTREQYQEFTMNSNSNSKNELNTFLTDTEITNVELFVTGLNDIT